MSGMLRLCFFFLIPCVLCAVAAQLQTTQLLKKTCGACGPQCEESCGSRNFRTCCLNYVKKRSSGTSVSSQDFILRSRSPWLSSLLDEASSSRSSVSGSDHDVQVPLLLAPDWLFSDSLHHNRDLNANYRENQVIGRLVGLSDIQPSEAPFVNGPSDSADTSVEIISGESNQGARTNNKHTENQHRPPPHWNSRHQRQHSNYPWSEVNRKLPIYSA